MTDLDRIQSLTRELNRLAAEIAAYTDREEIVPPALLERVKVLAHEAGSRELADLVDAWWTAIQAQLRDSGSEN